VATPYPVVFFDLGDTLVDRTHQWAPGAREVLRTLSDGGCRLGIISNTGDLGLPELLKELPEDFPVHLFEEQLLLLSSQEGVAKPALEIFRRAVSRAGVAASQCLFVTENALHVLAALQAGMHAVRVLPPPEADVHRIPQLLQELANLPG